LLSAVGAAADNSSTPLIIRRALCSTAHVFCAADNNWTMMLLPSWRLLCGCFGGAIGR
jgi:hypothetical protein